MELKVGRVVRADAKVCHVDIDGRTLLAAPRGKLFEHRAGPKNPIAVGDFVRVDLTGDPAGIEEVLPRRNSLSRVASSHDPREQVLIANVDLVLIVASLRRPGFSSNRIDRILAACTYEEIPSALILNKIDLADPDEIEAIAGTYAAAGQQVLPTSAQDGRGLDELRTILKEKVSLFYGPSGAGKSSLINAMQPGLTLKTSGVSKHWKTGRHTTTFTQLHPLDFGGYIADTPGIRSFKLYDVNAAELRDLFPEFASAASRCRYDNCSHDHEPDCGVFAAVESGEIAPSRYASYLEMLDEISSSPATETGFEPPESLEGDS